MSAATAAAYHESGRPQNGRDRNEIDFAWQTRARNLDTAKAQELIYSCFPHCVSGQKITVDGFQTRLSPRRICRGQAFRQNHTKAQAAVADEHCRFLPAAQYLAHQDDAA